MRLKLTLNRAGGEPSGDILVTVDTSVTVGELAAAIVRTDPRRTGIPAAGGLTLRIDDSASPTALTPDATVAEAGIRSGHRVSVTSGGSRFGEVPEAEAAAAILQVESGPDQGKRFPLRLGSNQVGRGRGNDAVLTDPQVSKAHARVNVGEVVEVIDLGSSNGLVVDGDLVPRLYMRVGDVVTLGGSEVRLVHHGRVRGLSEVATYDHNRAPRIDVVFEGEELPAPPLPDRFKPSRIPIIPVIAPVFLGLIMYALTRQLYTIIFVAMSPVMVVGNVVENRIFGKRETRKAVAKYHEDLVVLEADLAKIAAEEVRVRRAEHPATDDLCREAAARGPALWSYQPDQRGFLEVRFGLGSLPSRNSIEMPNRNDPAPGTWEALKELEARWQEVAGVPVAASLAECGSIGVAGPRSRALGSVRALLVQLASLHSPAEVVFAGIVTSDSVDEWDWVKWLPHTGSEHSPLTGDHLVASPGGALRLVAALEEVVAARSKDAGAPNAPRPMPAIVVLVEDDAPVERSRLVELGEQGRRCGLHLVWVAEGHPDLPAVCRSFFAIDPSDPDRGVVGHVDGGIAHTGVATEAIPLSQAQELARSLAPVVDSGARVADDSDLPARVSFVTLSGPELAASGAAVLDRWRTSNSLPGQADGARRSKDNHLRALVGMAAGQAMVLDLREHGPHALVGGTTGSGKSEFLQTWVMGMAIEHSPARVTFLFVDYKGGSAFAECTNLPHSVGLVTDLSPHLVRRALTSLNAELHHRERVLQAKKAKDLLELERRGDPEAPPSLIIVVDEFAALATEVPEFVDGVVNVAQRGRSLGLHLILATQRPAGVIKDNLRANTNLRVALRMADDSDSDDVIGTVEAARFDPGLPGRGVAKVGPGRLTPFQSGYVGGHTSDTPPPPEMRIEGFAVGGGELWEEPEKPERAPEGPVGPSDLKRLVASVNGANELAGLPAPRRPWLDSLAEMYDLARMPQSRTDSELTFGILDDPAHQRQVPVSFLPDRDGNMIVYGTGGSGKSTLLRTFAIAAGLGIRGGPCHVYGLDFGARGLQMLEVLPHVGSVIPGEDDERVQRLLRMLRTLIDDRAVRYAAHNSSTIEEYRSSAGQPDEPRILVLVDNLGAFRQAYEVGAFMRYWDLFQAIAADGRQVGVHVIVSADRPGVVPSALSSVIQQRLVLRLASENDLTAVGLKSDVFGEATVPGRGFLGDAEVQVAVLGGTSNTARQATVVRQLAAQVEELGRAPAPAIRRLEDNVALGALPVEVDGRPVLGIADETLAPIGFVPEDVLLVVGPGQSGKTSVVASIGLSLRRQGSGAFAYFGAGRSALRSMLRCEHEAVGPAESAEMARSMTEAISSGSSDLRTILIEDVSSFNGTEAEMPLQDLVKAARIHGVFVVADSDTSTMGTWPLQQLVKAPRHGIALQPDQFDGDTIFKTPFPRVNRADLPPGRGFYVRGGVATKVQCALPDLEVDR